MTHLHRTIVACGFLLMAGFVGIGEAEPAPLQGGRRAPQAPVAKPTPAGDVGRLTREYASMRADFEAAMESQRSLIARIITLEQENQAQKERIQQLQNLISAMDQRFGEMDKRWRARMDELYASVEREREQRRREQEALLKGVSAEIERSSRHSAAQASGNFKTLVVQKGDTLGAIAKISGVSVEELRRVNGLKNDNIFIGQNLKIPVK